MCRSLVMVGNESMVFVAYRSSPFEQTTSEEASGTFKPLVLSVSHLYWHHSCAEVSKVRGRTGSHPRKVEAGNLLASWKPLFRLERGPTVLER
jgi:hypothetical protein